MRTALAAVALVFAAPAAAQSVETAEWGRTQNGRTVELATLRNARGTTLKVSSFGAVVTSLEVADRSGKLDNVVLGYGSFADYEAKIRKNYFGAVVGRYAGRIANARYTLDGQEVQLQPNDGPNALHGGAAPGFESRVWNMRSFREGDVVGVALDYVSANGEQGFPGELKVRVTYRLEPDDAVRIDYRATTDRPTVINLTNHSYFNLAGAASGSVAAQRLAIPSERYVEDRSGIPTGSFPSVADTPLDFRKAHAIGERIDVKAPMMSPRGGYNHAWLLASPPAEGLVTAAVLEDPGSGRRLTVETSEPSIQVYTGDYIDGQDQDGTGHVIQPRDGIALETQHLSDAPNQPSFASTVLRPGEMFRSTTVWRFGIIR